jgi:hypothetical protein
MEGTSVVGLTDVEELEFTTLNCVAFDLVRKESREKGQVPPCWLCMSETAKAEAKSRVLDTVSTTLGRKIRTDLEFNLLFSEAVSGFLPKWREAELEFKKMREQGNPRAFFAE